MGVSIKISVKLNSQNQTARTSSVTVSVIGSWTARSFNQKNPPGQLTINGTPYSFNASFNKRNGSSGSKTFFSKTVTVSHDSNGKATVNCSAWFKSGISSGTVRASTSTSLKTIAAVSPGGSTTTVKPSNRVTIDKFGLQTGTDRSIYVTWKWTKTNTENYRVIWYYDTGNSVWFVGNDSTETNLQSIYSAPSNAKKVKVKIKPISKTYTVNNKETSYWTADWSEEKVYNFDSNPPTKPATPTVTIEDYTLTATLDNLNVNGTHIEFQIVRDNSTVFDTGLSAITTSHAAYTCTVLVGSKYKVRARAVRNPVTSTSTGTSKLEQKVSSFIKKNISEYSDWSDYSSEVGTVPSAPTAFTVCKATSKTSVYLEWEATETAKTYTIEYSKKIEYFDGSDQVSSITGIETTKYEKTGLETGDEYFFRIQAVNDLGESGWSEISSVRIGKKPAAPTTWSSTTTAITGETVNLYWVHNAEDGSSEEYAEVEIYVGDTGEVYTIRGTETEDDEDANKTHVYPIDTTSYSEGTTIRWRVRTSGVTLEYGDWSIQRTIEVYAQPTLELTMEDTAGESIETLKSFPFYISALAGPNTQQPIGYHLSVVSNDYYETIDEVGNTKIIGSGEEIFSRYFDIREQLVIEFSANNIDLQNGVSYTITCIVSMNSGLTVEKSITFDVEWTDAMYQPSAEISIDTDILAAYIKPYCVDETEASVEGVTLSVYRREFDGTFTEIAKGLDNSLDTFVTDPHPALDYARYRIVAISESTGAVGYYDVPAQPIGETSAVIQWNEKWTSFETTSPDPLAEPAWTGSMLKLPYNIDVSDSNKSDVALVEYIGRTNPVSYYGTQLGRASTWNSDVPKSDKETLYNLRRLAIWMDDVYVREPSGSGYWANIAVSFSQKHKDLVIPVTLSITRVEGGK